MNHLKNKNVTYEKELSYQMAPDKNRSQLAYQLVPYRA